MVARPQARSRLPTIVAFQLCLAALQVMVACAEPSSVTALRDTLGDTGDVAQRDSTDDAPEQHVDVVATLERQQPLPGTRLGHNYRRDDGLYSAPLPCESLRKTNGFIDLSRFPNPLDNELVGQLLTVLQRSSRGFAASAPTFFSADAPLDPATLPDVFSSTSVDSAVALIDVDPSSPEFGRRYPIDVDVQADGGPYGALNLLGVLPLQGVVPRPGTLHAVVVTRGVLDLAGAPLGRSPALARLLSGDRPEGLGVQAHQRYLDALSALLSLGNDLSQIVGLTAFETDHPTTALRQYLEDAHARNPSPQLSEPPVLNEVFDDFCVYEARWDAPNYQHGTPPYADAADGGGWESTPEGSPLPNGTEASRLVLTIPRSPMPGEGYPLAVMIRTGGGGDRPLVDRGVRAVAGGPAVEAGTGPALQFAQVGFAGASFDGPHGGLRNATGGDEQFLMFNVANVVAMRDNIRQTALEAAYVTQLLAELVVDTGDCPGASPQTRFDGREGAIALLGHSMGATVAPLALAVEPRFGALILSGAGGSWIQNVLYKQLPLEVRPLAELLVGYSDRSLHPFDPALGLLQWALEPADPPLYGPGPSAGEDTRHILMLQGIVDHYILPPIANATSLAWGLELAGPSLDAEHPELAAFRPLEGLLGLVNRGALSYPVQGAETTRVVAQHLEGPVEDGHEVVFQTPGPKLQYRCFLQTWKKAGTPTVPAPSDGTCAP